MDIVIPRLEQWMRDHEHRISDDIGRSKAICLVTHPAPRVVSLS